MRRRGFADAPKSGANSPLFLRRKTSRYRLSSTRISAR
ncbi:MAG: hypothetical protein KDD85_09590 [Parvularculaceae bacterium]|nr:hypothetical protein [Parvularculaceae bacterium]